MYLYLVEHGEAKPAETDPARGLTAKGTADVRKVAAHLRKLNLDIKRIYHSGKTRAHETASILAAQLSPVKGVIEAAGLAPQDDPQIWHERLKALDEDMVLVGHLPHLRRLASLLLCGDSERAVVHLKTGGIVCLRRLEDDWSLEWAIPPELFS
ncbi:MAG TPA: phosphohistidine phosphatase SixA [Syntrophorhabdales bacterium]|nr:phosphohistidine phosphatase SixA [Syntrophorhabdales bacterium]